MNDDDLNIHAPNVTDPRDMIVPVRVHVRPDAVIANVDLVAHDGTPLGTGRPTKLSIDVVDGKPGTRLSVTFEVYYEFGAARDAMLAAIQRLMMDA